MKPFCRSYQIRAVICVLASLLWSSTTNRDFLNNTVAAQDDFALTGTIRDADNPNKGVPGATVLIRHHTSKVTGTNGDFRIPLPLDMKGTEIQLQVSKQGCQDTELSHFVRTDRKNNLPHIMLRCEKAASGKNLANSVNPNAWSNTLLELMKNAKLLKDGQQYEQSLQKYEASLGLIRKAKPSLKNKENEMECLIQASWLQMALGKYTPSQQLLEEAKALATTTAGAGRYLARIILAQGDLAHVQGKDGETEVHYDGARERYRKLNDKSGEAQVLSAFGNLARSRSQYKLAREYFNQALKLLDEKKDPVSEAHVLLGLGDLESTENNYGAAQRHYKNALDNFRGKGDSLGQAHILLTLGDLQRKLEDYVEARESYKLAQGLYKIVGNNLGQAQALNGMGDWASAQKKYPLAREYYDEALRLVSDTHPLVNANILMSLGTLELLLGNHLTAQEKYEAADLIYQKLDHKLGEATVQRKLGDLERELAHQETADKRYGKAEDLFKEMGMEQEVREIKKLRAGLKSQR